MPDKKPDFKPKARKLIINSADEKPAEEMSVEEQLTTAHAKESVVKPASTVAQTSTEPSEEEGTEKKVVLQDKLNESDDLDAAIKSTLEPKPKKASAKTPASPSKPKPTSSDTSPAPAPSEKELDPKTTTKEASVEPKEASSPTPPAETEPAQQPESPTEPANTDDKPDLPVDEKKTDENAAEPTEDLEALRQQYHIPIDKVSHKMSHGREFAWVLVVLAVIAGALVAVFLLKPELVDSLRDQFSDL